MFSCSAWTDPFPDILFVNDINTKAGHGQIPIQKSLYLLFNIVDPLSALGAASASISLGEFVNQVGKNPI
jgi:hypothetical protein